MPDSGRLASVIERIRALEWQARALRTPTAGGDIDLAVDNVLTALSLCTKLHFETRRKTTLSARSRTR
jgi:hypothetical protein